jgi:F-type H+-transporting ATPase subunit b
MLFDASFWVCIGFILLFVFVGKNLWRTITGALEERAEKIQADIKDAAKRRQEALTMLKACKRRQIEATERAKEIIQHAHEEAERLRQKVLDDIKEHTLAEERLLQERIRQTEDRAMAEIRERALMLATAATRDLILKHQNPEFEEALLQKTLNTLEEAPQPFLSTGTYASK